MASLRIFVSNCHLPLHRQKVVVQAPAWLRIAGHRHYSEAQVSLVRHALEDCSASLIGVGQLAFRLSNAYFPAPKPFGFHVAQGFVEDESIPEILHGCVRESRSETVRPGDSVDVHCGYAVKFEFPWFPLFVGLSAEKDVRDTLARSIVHHVNEGPADRVRRWWFAYELFFERLPLSDVNNSMSMLPFLPPDRFFCTAGNASARHGVLDNLLGNKDFCPFVEKFAGANDASEKFKGELLDVLSPICMMSIKEFLNEADLKLGMPIDTYKVDRLMNQLADGHFVMSDAECAEFNAVFGLEASKTGKIGDCVDASPTLSAATLRDVAQWLRGQSKLAERLREHLLGSIPNDVRWHAPREIFLERLSRVISSVETRASQMIEGTLPPERKERFFVDEMSKPWNKDDLVLNSSLVYRLQQGLLSEKRFQKVCETQANGEPRRTTQNWISSEKHDDMVGKEKILHYLPPPPETLHTLYNGYFDCVNRMLADPSLDPIVCATVAKIGLNTLHPMADGNGRVQRMLFQLILFKFNFLPRVNVPVSVIMLRDRTGYEVLQQGHVDQIMAGLRHHMLRLEGDDEDSFLHFQKQDGILAAYQYQDFTFAVSCMIKLMQGTLPVIAAKAYFLQRFDWRVDELLKDDALLPPKAATRIAKAFKNDPSKDGLSYSKLVKLFLTDGWWIGLRRIWHYIRMAEHPEDVLSLRVLRSSFRSTISKSNRRFWLGRSGQIVDQLQIIDNAKNSGGQVRWVSVSLEKFEGSAIALKRALNVSKPGDTVIAVHYPQVMHELITDGVYPELTADLFDEVIAARKQIQDLTKGVVDEHQKEGVFFQCLVGDGSPGHLYKPASALCNDLKSAEVKPFRIFVGYDQSVSDVAEKRDMDLLGSRSRCSYLFLAPRHKFTDYIVHNSPCDVSIIKKDEPFWATTSWVRWVGISRRNIKVSVVALKQAFANSHAGDTVVAVHYPINPFYEDGSSLQDAHFSSVCGDNLDIIMDSMHSRVVDTVSRVAEDFGRDGVTFKLHVGAETLEPHVDLVRDAESGIPKFDIPPPDAIYVGYSQRRNRARLVNPNKLYDVAEYIVHKSLCNIILVKDANVKPTSPL